MKSPTHVAGAPPHARIQARTVPRQRACTANQESAVVRKFWVVGIILVAAAGCDRSTSDVAQTGVSESELQFLRFTSSSAVAVRTASFWAVKGQTRKLEMRYAPT